MSPRKRIQKPKLKWNGNSKPGDFCSKCVHLINDKIFGKSARCDYLQFSSIPPHDNILEKEAYSRGELIQYSMLNRRIFQSVAFSRGDFIELLR